MNMRQRRPLFIAIAVVAIVGAVWAYVLFTTPGQQTLDQRVQDVGSQLKCLICQGESVADSPSELAQQMRGVIRQKLQSGQSEQEVINYFEAHYGLQILLKPQWQGFQLLAWLVPIAMLLGGALLIFLVLRSWSLQAVRATTERSTAEGTVPYTDGRQECRSHGIEDGSEEDDDLELYQKQLEEELAAEDPIFARPRREGN